MISNVSIRWVKDNLTSEEVEQIVCRGYGYLLTVDDTCKVRMCRTPFPNSECSFAPNCKGCSG